MRNIQDKKQLMKLVSAITLWDGGVYKYGKEGKSFYFAMNTTSKEYALYCKDILENVTSIKLSKVNMDTHIDGYNRKQKYRLDSKPHPIFRKLRENIYMGGYKSAPSIYIKNMNAECLAILYMADGSLVYKDNAINSLTLNTKRLTEGDNKLLANRLNQVFGLEFAVNRQNQYTYLRLKAKHYNKFFKLIGQFILSDFKYKVPDEKLLTYYKNKYEISYNEDEVYKHIKENSIASAVRNFNITRYMATKLVRKKDGEIV